MTFPMTEETASVYYILPNFTFVRARTNVSGTCEFARTISTASDNSACLSFDNVFIATSLTDTKILSNLTTIRQPIVALRVLPLRKNNSVTGLGRKIKVVAINRF